jgi:hypothetical protein
LWLRHPGRPTVNLGHPRYLTGTLRTQFPENECKQLYKCSIQMSLLLRHMSNDATRMCGVTFTLLEGDKSRHASVITSSWVQLAERNSTGKGSWCDSPPSEMWRRADFHSGRRRTSHSSQWPTERCITCIDLLPATYRAGTVTAGGGWPRLPVHGLPRLQQRGWPRWPVFRLPESG